MRTAAGFSLLGRSKMPDSVAKQPGADKQGKGAGGDGQQTQFVPMERLQEEIDKRQNLETQLAELRGTVEGLKTASAAPKTEKKPDQPQFSRAQLREAVDSGRITQSEADAIWDDQQERRHSESLKTVKNEVKQEITETAKVGGQIDRYKSLVPDLSNRTSESFKKVEAEFRYMTGELGMPNNEKTELAALRAVFGSVDVLQAKATAKDARPDTHRESTGRGAAHGDDEKDGAPRDMPGKLKAHYQRMIDRRIYKGWDDPTLKAELAHVRSSRQRAA